MNQRDVCGGREIQRDEAEENAAQAREVSLGKVPKLGCPQPTWKALGMQTVSVGTAGGCRQSCLGEKRRGYGQGSPSTAGRFVSLECRQAGGLQGEGLPRETLNPLC